MTSTHRIRAIVERLLLIVVIIGATALLLASLAVPALTLTSDGIDLVTSEIFDVGPLPELEAPPENSFIYAADGSLLDEINFQENREPVTFDQIPDIVVDAVVATEDAEFWEHNGVNSDAILRSALQNVAAGTIVGGGSTITQQYVKIAYAYESDDATAQTLERKIREANWAIQLEKELEKQEILERYLNTAYFGSGAWGIGTAAERYFSKDVTELTLGEAATLAAIIRAPGANNPIDNPDNAIARRNIVLGQMAEEGFISGEQSERAQSEDIVLTPSQSADPRYPFWTTWITQLLTDEGMAATLGDQQEQLLTLMGDDAEARTRRVYQGGLRIHTTLDPSMQRLAEDAILDHLTYEDEPRAEIAEEPTGGLLSIEPGTGAIRTMALGPQRWGSCLGNPGDPADDEWVGTTESGRLLCDLTKFNPLVPTPTVSEGRAPGSSFKPFVTATALESGYSPGYTIESDDYDNQGGEPIEECPDSQDETGFYTPANTSPGGLYDMYSAIENSVNVYHATLAGRVGPDNVAEMAARLGMPDWKEAQEATGNAACSIGLGAYEATALEMASAYATLANSGSHCAPFPIARIEDREGNVVWEHSPDCSQVLDESIANRVIDILQGPPGPDGTAPVVGETLEPHPVRGKTGTTTNYLDAWFMGFTTRYATAAWIGYANGTQHYDSVASAVAACPANHDGEGGDEYPDRQCPPPGAQTMEDVTIGGETYSTVAGGTIPAPMWATYMSQVMADFEPESFPEPPPLPEVTVPDLVAAGSISAAEELAEEANLQLGQEEVEHWQPAGTIVGQEPEAGTRMLAGGFVFLQISDGSGELPQVPDVVGQPRANAVDTLADAGYTVAEFDRPVSDQAQDGIVLRQQPSAGAGLEPGSQVSIEVGVYTAPEPSPEPSPTPSPEPEPTTPPPSPTPSPTPTETGPPGDPPVPPPGPDGGGGDG